MMHVLMVRSAVRRVSNTQVGFSRLAHIKGPISDKSDIGWPHPLISGLPEIRYGMRKSAGADLR